MQVSMKEPLQDSSVVLMVLRVSLQDSLQEYLLNNISKHMQEYMKVHMMVQELMRTNMLINTRSYISVIGQKVMQVNTVDSLQDQEHILDNIQDTLIEHILVLIISKHIKKHMLVQELTMVSIQETILRHMQVLIQKPILANIADSLKVRL